MEMFSLIVLTFAMVTTALFVCNLSGLRKGASRAMRIPTLIFRRFPC